MYGSMATYASLCLVCSVNCAAGGSTMFCVSGYRDQQLGTVFPNEVGEGE